jgi:hypothetical protein
VSAQPVIGAIGFLALFLILMTVDLSVMVVRFPALVGLQWVDLHTPHHVIWHKYGA